LRKNIAKTVHGTFFFVEEQILPMIIEFSIKSHKVESL